MTKYYFVLKKMTSENTKTTAKQVTSINPDITKIVLSNDHVWYIIGHLAHSYAKRKTVGSKIIALKGYRGTLTINKQNYKKVNFYFGKRNYTKSFLKDLKKKKATYLSDPSAYVTLKKAQKFNHYYVLFVNIYKLHDTEILGIYDNVKDAYRDMHHKSSIDLCDDKNLNLSSWKENDLHNQITLYNQDNSINRVIKIQEIDAINARQF